MTFPGSRVGFAVHHARAGETVLMVVPELKVAAQVLTMVEHFRHLPGERIVHVLGVQGFTTPAGGWIRFVSVRSLASLRNGHRTVDRILVDPDVELTTAVLEALPFAVLQVHQSRGEPA